MSPSSGARSGTRPSRRGRNAGDGKTGPTELACGHAAHDDPVTTGARELFRCPDGCGLVRRR